MTPVDGVLAHLRANHDRILTKLVEFASILHEGLEAWARYWQILGEAGA
jgi:hypothetical protein